MRRTFLLLLLLLAALPLAAAAAERNFVLVDPPKALPDVRFVDGEGRNRALADFKGKVVLLNVWATWCVPCRKEMPTLDRLQNALGGADIQVIALSIDRQGLDVVRKFYGEIGIRHLEMHVDSSGKAARELGAVGLPTTLLVDRAGREVGRLVGPAEWDAPDMIAVIRQRIDQEHDRP
ncbi:MAG: TlpA disulfide reductase family protein [Reyranella sp.]|nr:TlpA disulfide reductase family protein [Reyranella sp.]